MLLDNRWGFLLPPANLSKFNVTRAIEAQLPALNVKLNSPQFEAMNTDRKPQVYRDVSDGMVHACKHGQGQIGPERAKAGVWNQNATEESIPEQHEINLLPSRLSADDRRIVAGMLEEAFSGGVFEALRVFEEFEIEPFRDGYEGSPYHDFIGRLELPDWEWPKS